MTQTPIAPAMPLPMQPAAAPTIPLPAEPPIPTVTPAPESRLDQLAALYDAVKAQAELAEQQLKSVTDAIKAELANAHPDAEKVQLNHPLLAQPLRLVRVESTRVDSKALQAAYPQIYAQVAKPSVTFRLGRVSGGTA
jgi:hypothetical protein